MRKMLIAVLTLSALSVSINTYAIEQKRIFNVSTFSRQNNTTEDECRTACISKSDPNVDSYTSKGWRINGSTSKKVIAVEYFYQPERTVDPFGYDSVALGCICEGPEYYIEKVEEKEIEASTELMKKEIELLKKENDMLKIDNESLKKENGSLKAKGKKKG